LFLEEQRDSFAGMVSFASRIRRIFLGEAEPYFKALLWFNLGISITSGIYNEVSNEWELDNKSCVDYLLSALGIDVEVVMQDAPHRFTNPRYPLHLAGWEDIDFALAKLQQGSSARALPTDPHCSIAGIRRDSNSQDTIPEETTTETEGTRSQPPPPNAQVSSVSYDDDFRFVNWYGIEYTFSVNQACCVQVMWEAAQIGTTALTAETIMDKGLGKVGRLRDVFKLAGDQGTHPAWGTMIIPVAGRKGMYRLSKPVPKEVRKPSDG
jgi:hypothetical protein